MLVCSHKANNMVLIQLSPDELKSLIAEGVQLALGNALQSVEPEAEKPISIHEAANLTGLAKQTLYQSLDVPKHKQGGKLFFFESEIIAWIKSGKRKNQFEIDSVVDAAIFSNKRKK